MLPPTAATDWLTKSDLMDFRRCRQGFLLLRSGEVAESAAVGTTERVVIDAGTDFDRGVRSRATPIVDDAGNPVAIADLFATDAVVLTDRLFLNRDLRFRGRPDGISMASGEFQPLEIKNRTQLQPSDLFELAFYWLLLEPYRLVPQADPVGWLQLADGAGGQAAPIRVDIPADTLTKVREVAAQARSALTDGIEPYWCNCSVCSQSTIPQTPAARRAASVRVINGIGRTIGAALAAGGVNTVGQLADLSGEDIRSTLAAGHGRRPSDKTIDGWKDHARVFIANSPELKSGHHDPLPERFVAFDLEYDTSPASVVWLLCAQTVGVDRPHRITVFADETGQAGLFTEFAGFLAQYPELPVVTWNGKSADLTAFDRSAKRYLTSASCDVAAFLEVLEVRHLDLLQWTRKALNLPIPSLGLKDVAYYFGLATDSDVGNGLMADGLWREYRSTGDTELKDQLITYNRSDVTILAGIHAHLRALHTESVTPVLGPPLFAADEFISHEAPPPPPPPHEPDHQPARRRTLRDRLRNWIGRGAVPSR
ncbi:hypothetical protein GS504_01470 [Rhodococcus hoagii]|nr:hypothetical protein [Prescottella equi]NKS71657.1 hypothetical protein [Prescottella equi]